MPEIISIKIDDAAVAERLREAARRMGSLSPVLRILGERMIMQTEERFDRQGPAPDGTPWAPLAASTLRQKKGRKILTESGNLRGRIRYQVIGDRTLAVGSAEPYAAIHQLGGTIKRAAGSVTVGHRTDAKGNLLTTEMFGGKGLIFAKATHRRVLTRTFASKAHDITIPARPFLGLSPENSKELAGFIVAYVVEAS